MQAKQKARVTTVPRSQDPIRFLVKNGWTFTTLAVAWGCSDPNVRKLADYNHVPPQKLAALMAATFGWASAGEVIDFWAERVDARYERKAASR